MACGLQLLGQMPARLVAQGITRSVSHGSVESRTVSQGYSQGAGTDSGLSGVWAMGEAASLPFWGWGCPTP